MSELPQALYYSKTHEWVQVERDDVCVIGITDFAQKALGDLVFVELPSTELDVAAGDEVAVVESVKTASDVYAPVSGKIVAVNPEVIENPGVVNLSPYEKGWLFKLKLHDKNQVSVLMDAATYQAQLSE